MNLAKLGILSLAAAVAVAGCSGTGDKVASGSKPNDGGKVAETTNAPADATAPDSGKVSTEVPPKGIVPLRDPNFDRKNKDVPLPPETGTEGWGPTKMSVPELAKSVSSHIASMKGTVGRANVYVKTPTVNGGATRAIREFKVQDSKTYRLDYLDLSNILPRTCFLLSNGTTKRQIITAIDQTDKKEIKVPVGQKLPEGKLKPDQIFEQWTRNFPRLMFLPLTDGVDSWSIVLPRLAAGEAGFRTTIEERLTRYQNKDVKSYRVHAVRKADAAKKRGSCEMEIIVDAQRYLPVTIRMISKDLSGNLWQTQWSAGWGFGKKFDPKEFKGIVTDKAASTTGTSGKPSFKGA